MADTKQEVIDELKASGNFVTRDEMHIELMDVLKNVQPIRTNQFDATTVSEKAIVEREICKWYSVVLGEHKTWDSTTTVLGLELVPSLVAGRIVEQLDNTPVRKLVTHYPGDKGVVPVENLLPIALRMASPRAATAAVTNNYDPISFATAGATAWLLVDNKLIRNATPPLVRYIENAMVRAIARLETTEFITGGGGTAFTGLRTGATAHDAATPIDTLGEITAAQVEADYWALDVPYRDNATWVLPGTVAAQIYSKNTNDIRVMDLQAKTIMGRPYVEFPAGLFESPADTKIYSFFGDMSYFYLEEDGQVRLKTNDQGVTLTTADQTVIVAQAETDGQVVLAMAINANKYNSS